MGIADRQNEREPLILLRAAQRHHRIARRWRSARLAGAIGFAALGPILAFWVESASATVAAIAGVWTLAGRTVLDHRERARAVAAALAQEQFDTEVFTLPWNAELVGPQPSPDDLHDAAQRERTDPRDWHVSPGELPRPLDILFCQRMVTVFGRRTNRAYASFVSVAAGTWLVGGVVASASTGMSLAEYLIGIFLPSQPALLDALDIARQHRRQASLRLMTERRIDEIVENGASHATIGTCRAIQDQLYALRHDAVRVPEWFYRARHARDTRAVHAAAGSVRARWLESLKHEANPPAA